LDGRDLYVWEQGDEDPLRDPESFVGAARAATAFMGDYAYVVLVARDMPVALGFDTLSSDYPNDRPVEFVGFDEGRERINLWSVGGEVAFDFNVLRMPDSATTSLTLSIFRTSKRDMWISAALGLPF
jgi:hypothetical protein